MKKLMLLAAMCAAVGSMVPAHAARTEAGTIVVPGVLDPRNNLPVTKHQRCAYLLAGSQDVFGHTTVLDASEEGKPWTVTVDKGKPWTTFFPSLATCEDTPNVSAHLNGEGTIPPGARYAIITIEGAAQASFEFKIG